MNFRNISAWSIRNPVPPIVLFVALLLAGIVSFSRMDVNNNPDIEFPGAQVIITQPGAAPTELEKQVTQIVEPALRSINGVDEINSTVREGMSMTFVQFQIGTDVDRGVNDIRDALTKVRSDLPDGILEPQVNRVDTTGEPIAYISAEAVDMTLEQLSWYVDDVVVKRLQGVPGAAASTSTWSWPEGCSAGSRRRGAKRGSQASACCRTSSYTSTASSRPPVRASYSPASCHSTSRASSAGV